MASSKDYLDFILEQLSELDEISHRAMMGEYVLYYRGKVFGGIYDDRFLVKSTKTAKAMMPEADLELPYDGAKEPGLLMRMECSGDGDTEGRLSFSISFQRFDCISLVLKG